MRYPITALAMVMFVSVFAAVAMASDNSTGNETNYNELDDFGSTTGASLRMLQLERSITKNIVIGNQTVSFLEEKYPNASFSNLTAIIGDMKSLLSDVKAYNVSEYNTTENAAAFVDFKKQAVNLTKEFRESVKQYLTADNKKKIKDYANGSIRNMVKDLDEMIKQRRQEFNAHKMNVLFGPFGVLNESTFNEIRNGTMNYTEFKDLLKGRFGNMTKDKKVDMILDIKDMKINKTMEKMQFRENVTGRLNGTVHNFIQRGHQNDSDPTPIPDAQNTKPKFNRSSLNGHNGD